MTVRLLDDLRRRGWHSSVMTTYSVDPSFYDGTVEMRLRIEGCHNNILMADRGMLARALAATPEAFVNAGRSYLVADVAVTGCFHPKLHLRLATGKARLVVGSANATAAGWGSNREIVTAIPWERTASGDSNENRVGPIIVKAYRYLDSWLAKMPGEAIAYKRDYHGRHSPWLGQIEPNSEPIVLADGSAIDLLCERADGGPGILARLGELVGDEHVERLLIVSPYWDSRLEGLRAVQTAFGMPPTLIILDPACHQFPRDRLISSDRIAFHALQSDRADRFLHAKIIVIQTAAADHVLFGSANCSDDALGSPEAAPRNAEASVYRRYRPGEALGILALDPGQAIAVESLEPPEKRELPPPLLSPPRGGTIERADQWLLWWPPGTPEPAGAQIEIGRERIALVAAGATCWRGPAPPDLPSPTVARIRYSDGRLSAPLIVHDRRMLRATAPGPVSRKLQRAFDRLAEGEGDIIDLAIDAHLLFAVDDEDAGEAVRRGGGGGGGGRRGAAAGGRDFENEAEFRRHVERIAATGRSGFYAASDPGLTDLLDIVIRGSRSLARSADRARDELQHLRDGEREDDPGQAGDPGAEGDDGKSDSGADSDNPPPPPPPPAAPWEKSPRVYSPDDLDLRRHHLLRALGSFEAMLDKLDARPHLVSVRLCAQCVFVFHLILFGCARRHRTPQGETTRLMSLGLAPGPNADRRNCFGIRVALLLRRLWGEAGTPGLLDGLDWHDETGQMPDDLFFLVVMSRWAIARSSVALASAAAPLPGSLRKMAVYIYRESTRFGPIDAAGEEAFIVQEERKLGFDAEETAALLKQHRDLLAVLSG